MTQFTTAFLKETGSLQQQASSRHWKPESIRTIILQEGMIAAMKEVGRLFEEGDYFVPEMLIAARAMQSGLAVLKAPSRRLRYQTVRDSGRGHS